MFRIDTQQIASEMDMSSDFISCEWDVRGIASGFLELAWAGMVNPAAKATAYLEASGTRACWCQYGAVCDILVSESCAGIELREGHGLSYIRVVFSGGGTTAGSMSIAATGKVLRDNGISGGQV